MNFLSETGKVIYREIEKHCKKLKMMEIDHLELAMLANSFDCYGRAAKVCNEEGFANKHAQIRPEYTVMKTEYANILKHAGKFGLNPADRDRIFKGLDKKEKKSLTDGLD